VECESLADLQQLPQITKRNSKKQGNRRKNEKNLSRRKERQKNLPQTAKVIMKMKV